jgi:hypothetical protein
MDSANSLYTEERLERLERPERTERLFATGDHCELSLVNVRGSVKVVGWDKPEVAVVAVKRLGNYMGAQQAFDETTVVMDQQGPVVSLRTRMARGFNPFAWIGLGTTPPEVDYTVQVPITSEVAVRTVSGPVQVTGIQGSVYVRSVNGDLYLQAITGNTMVHSVNGRVSGQELAGNLGARTVDGAISIRGSRLASLSGRTVSGDISLESPLDPRGTYSAKTVSGNLHLFLPTNTSATIQLSSTSGKAQCDLPCTVSESRRGDWRGVLNGGGATVDFHTVSGNLLVGMAGPDEPPAAGQGEPAQPPTAGEAPEMAVLRAVERGDLTVEDALKQLEDLMA